MDEILIVAGGNYPKNIEIKQDLYSCIIAVDRGLDYLINNGIKADYLIGDFDSTEENIDKINDVKVIQYPIEKSMTDLDIAIEKVIRLKPKGLTILGGTGTRLDHTIMNVFLLKKLSINNIKAKIIDDNNEITFEKGNILIEKGNYKYLSIIPLNSQISISLEGTKYPLNNRIVNFGDSLCISNEIINTPAKITVDDYVIIIQSKD